MDRVNHGCEVIEREKSKYLIVFGGRNSIGSNLPSTDIILLNLDLKSEGWKVDARYFTDFRKKVFSPPMNIYFY